KSASMRATGQPGQGIQHTTFDGGVEFSETRPATGKTAATNRTARSVRLIVDTKPGFGAVERADFRGNARFLNGDVRAEAQRALYNIDKDMLDLSQSPGDPGPKPTVVNPQLTVQGLNIHLVPSSEKLSADTEVRSTIQGKKKDA